MLIVVKPKPKANDKKENELHILVYCNDELVTGFNVYTEHSKEEVQQIVDNYLNGLSSLIKFSELLDQKVDLSSYGSIGELYEKCGYDSNIFAKVVGEVELFSREDDSDEEDADCDEDECDEEDKYTEIMNTIENTNSKLDALIDAVTKLLNAK